MLLVFFFDILTSKRMKPSYTMRYGFGIYDYRLNVRFLKRLSLLSALIQGLWFVCAHRLLAKPNFKKPSCEAEKYCPTEF